jgi:HEAT repeat protein
LKQIAFLILVATAASAQSTDSDPKQRVRAVRDYSKQGDDAISKIVPYLADADTGVRVEATKALVDIGGPKTLDGLLKAAADNDPEVQIRATDGLVNIYLPGYIKTGFSGTLSRAGTSIRGKFTDTNDQIIDAYVMVRPEVILALGKIARGAASIDARTNATRALGVLRGRAALPDVIEGLHSKDDKLMYEALVAIEKIADPAASPRVTFLLRDLAEKIRVQALEVTGLLRNKDAAPAVRDALEHARSVKERRAALEALAQIADPADRTLFINNLQDKDDGVRAAAAEGIGRVRNFADVVAINQAFSNEHGMNPRLAEAFALVSLGKVDTERFGPLRYLVNALALKSWRGVASAFVIELARDAAVRQAIYTMLPEAAKDEKQQIALVLASSGDRDSVPVLEGLSRDPDPDVAAEGIRSLRILRTRLP